MGWKAQERKIRQMLSNAIVALYNVGNSEFGFEMHCNKTAMIEMQWQ